MILTTTPTIEGRTIREYKGVVFGEVISGVNFLRDFAATIRNIVGGRSGSYEEELVNARNQAMNELADRAARLGADAVVGIDIEAEPGAYIVTARHPKMSTLNSGRYAGKSSVWEFVNAGGREYDVWYVGGVTDENAREVSVKLDFLQPGVKYEATVYADAPDADYETNPQAYTITRQTVTSETVLDLRMARAGGFAVSLRSE